MISTEINVQEDSEYFLYTPSTNARELLFYPTIIGHFTYLPGYYIHRNNFDSFLLILIEKGRLELKINGSNYIAEPGSLAFIDCYSPHEYGSLNGCTCLWMHFDGCMTRKYFDYIYRHFGSVIIPSNFQAVHYELETMYRAFRNHKFIDEPRESLHITAILNSLLSIRVDSSTQISAALKRAVNYINEHFSEPVSLEDLAHEASLSPYYFSRSFAKETGMSPHQYLIAVRISSAKYLLSTTDMTVKEVAYKAGFSDESSFCASFRKREGITPTAYRAESAHPASLH